MGTFPCLRLDPTNRVLAWAISVSSAQPLLLARALPIA
jgi:hypothetical protein